MAGIYLHIPFCKKACYYCDFHFSTSVAKKSDMVRAICKELELRSEELIEPVETIYFGGGTPSLLDREELDQIITTVYNNFSVAKDMELTLEANPDDLYPRKLEEIKASGINRISLGVQSFDEGDLRLMNRAHNAQEALEAVRLIREHYTNYSVDLIYGIPGMSQERWEENLETIHEMGVPHFSAYALTVEPRTVLEKMIIKGKIRQVPDEVYHQQYEVLTSFSRSRGYDNYEFSNFGKPGFFSRNNMGYWSGRAYLGVGPSAHSFDGRYRKWNVANNAVYLREIGANNLPYQSEELNLHDHYNEMIMTRLRTKWGVSLEEVEARFGKAIVQYLVREAQPSIRKKLLYCDSDHLKITEQAKFLTDGIAAELFLVDLENLNS